jgi:hypothetical protein
LTNNAISGSIRVYHLKGIGPLDSQLRTARLAFLLRNGTFERKDATMMVDESPLARQFTDALEPHQLVMAAEAVQLLGLNEQAEYLIELAYLGFDAATLSRSI